MGVHPDQFAWELKPGEIFQAPEGMWEVDRRKLPNSLAGLAEQLKKPGLDFGLWMEPEMVLVLTCPSVPTTW